MYWHSECFNNIPLSCGLLASLRGNLKRISEQLVRKISLFLYFVTSHHFLGRRDSPGVIRAKMVARYGRYQLGGLLLGGRRLVGEYSLTFTDLLLLFCRRRVSGKPPPRPSPRARRFLSITCNIDVPASGLFNQDTKSGPIPHWQL